MAKGAGLAQGGLKTSQRSAATQCQGRTAVLKLFTAHNSICTQKVFLTLLEKDLPWTSEYIDLFNNEQYRPDYLRLNPHPHSRGTRDHRIDAHLRISRRSISGAIVNTKNPIR